MTSYFDDDDKYDDDLSYDDGYNDDYDDDYEDDEEESGDDKSRPSAARGKVNNPFSSSSPGSRLPGRDRVPGTGSLGSGGGGSSGSNISRDDVNRRPGTGGLGGSGSGSSSSGSSGSGSFYSRTGSGSGSSGSGGAGSGSGGSSSGGSSVYRPSSGSSGSGSSGSGGGSGGSGSGGSGARTFGGSGSSGSSSGTGPLRSGGSSSSSGSSGSGSGSSGSSGSGSGGGNSPFIGSRFGSGGSSGSGSSSSGSGSSGSSGSGGSGSSVFRSPSTPSTSGGSASGGGDQRRSAFGGSSGSGSSSSGSGSSGSRPTSTTSDKDKKDDKPSGNPLSGAAGALGGLSSRFGIGGKKDDAGGGAGAGSKSGDKKPDSGAARPNPFGGITSRLPGASGGGGDAKPSATRSATGSDKKPDSSSSRPNPFGGIASRLPGASGGGGDAKPSATRSAVAAGSDKKPEGGGRPNPFGGITSRLPIGGRKDDGGGGGGSGAAPKKPDAPASAASASARPSFGSRVQPSGTTTPSTAKPAASSATRSATAEPQSGSIFSRLTAALPFGGAADDKRSQPKTSKTRASKVPVAEVEGMSLDTKLDILGVGLIFGAIMLIVSSASPDRGALTGTINTTFSQLLGWGAIAVPVMMFAVGAWLIGRHFGENAPTISVQRLAGLGMAFVGLLLLFQYLEMFNPIYSTVDSQTLEVFLEEFTIKRGQGGGLVGSQMYLLLVRNITEVGGVFVLIGWFVISLMLITGTSAAELAMISVSTYRNFQIARQRRAQIHRARELQRQQATALQEPGISIGRPALPELPMMPAAAALPASASPLDEQGSAIPIEERSIPIRMGGQMINAPEPALAAQNPGVPSAPPGYSRSPAAPPPPSQPASQPDGGRGGFGRFLGGGNTGNTTPQPAAASAQPENADGGGLRGLLGRRGTTPAASPPAPTMLPGQPAPAAPSARPVPPVPTAQPSSGIPLSAVPADVLSEAASHVPPPAAPPPTARPAIPGMGAAPTFGRPAPASTQPTTVPSAGDRQPTPAVSPASSPFSRPVPGQSSASAPSSPTAQPERPAASAASPGVAAPSASPSGAAPSSAAPDAAPAGGDLLGGRMSRLDQIRAGIAHPGDTAAAAPAAPTTPSTPTVGTPTVITPPAASQQSTTSTDSPASSGVGGSRIRPFTPTSTGDGTPAAPAAPQPIPTAPPAAQSPAAFNPVHNGAPEPRPTNPTINVPSAPQVVPSVSAYSSRQRKPFVMPDYRTLLKPGSEQEFDRESLVKRARVIEETLQSFGAPGRVVEINTGPVITQFGVEPGYLTARGGNKNRVKVSAIAQLDKDLQLALGAKAIRVEAPVPGKGFVGIEVPNDEAATVSLRDVMESREFNRIKSPLAIALGQSVDGAPVAGDLTAMPHLLIAGTTGSGKSVCVNSIIASLILRNSPEIVKFIMVDPKRVELTGYNGIPHLVAPVVVELERIVGVLKWVTREMDERYKKFSNAGARNIVDFNNHLPENEEPMPYIVVIIDELADLMMLAPDETERVITRIAALARATGIHLVIATQRPSVDVVTGLIKANFPARIAFAVASGIDSRVILDQPGAERLLGRGDMLYMSGDSPAPQRLQGVFVSDMEINNMTRYWRQQQLDDAPKRPISVSLDDESGPSTPMSGRAAMSAAASAPTLTQSRPQSTSYPGSAPTSASSPAPASPQNTFWDAGDDDDDGPDGANGKEREDGEDEMYDEAVELVRRLGKASVSLLQRRLRIGYTRAARLIDVMEERGVVGPATEGSKPRDVLSMR